MALFQNIFVWPKIKLSILFLKCNSLLHSYSLNCRVGYRNPVPIWHLCNRYVLEPNQNADFGAMPERSVEIFVLCFSETDVRSIITGTAHKTLFPDWENAHELNSEKSNNTSPTNLRSNTSVLFSHSDLKAQLGKWEHPRNVWMQYLLWRQQLLLLHGLLIHRLAMDYKYT